MSRHNVLPGPGSNVQSQRSRCSLNVLMCSFNSSNTLVLCTIDWFQDGRAWMTKCSYFLSQQSHRRFIVISQSRFLSLNLSTNEDDDFTAKLLGLFPDTIRTPTYPLSMSTIVSTVALACASGHHTATPEMNWKSIGTHGISVSYLTCLCQSLFPLAWTHRFRTTERLASESGCEPLSWPCSAGPQDLSMERHSCLLSEQFPCPSHRQV